MLIEIKEYIKILLVIASKQMCVCVCRHNTINKKTAKQIYAIY